MRLHHLHFLPRKSDRRITKQDLNSLVQFCFERNIFLSPKRRAGTFHQLWIFNREHIKQSIAIEVSGIADFEDFIRFLIRLQCFGQKSKFHPKKGKNWLFLKHLNKMSEIRVFLVADFKKCIRDYRSDRDLGFKIHVCQLKWAKWLTLGPNQHLLNFRN